jgi:hypothetical protein
VSGRVVDAGTRAPVERFAARIRALSASDHVGDDATARVLRRQIDALRDQPLAAELQARLAAVEHGDRASRPRRAPADLGAIEARPDGRFEFAGLDEGAYVLEIGSARHPFASIAPIEVRRGATRPEIEVELAAGISVRGVVVSKRDGAAIHDATVELDWVDDAAPGLRGDAIVSTRTDRLGRFELPPAPSGRYFLSAAHEQMCRQRTDPFDLRGERDDFRIALGETALLCGLVRGIPSGLEGDVAVLAIGAGTLRTAKPGAGGAYRIERLQPGSYLLRAVMHDSGDSLARQTAALFEAGRDGDAPHLAIAEGEQRELDLTLDLPAVGTVEGSVTLNGQPALGFQVVLRAGAAARSSGTSLRSTPDRRGQFTLRNVPSGDYALQVISTSSRQEVHREPIAVAAGASTWVHVIVSVGGVRGRIERADPAAAEPLDGTLTILPGATAAPGDLREYARSNRVHVLRIRGGAFQAEHLTAGPALAIVELRGREPVEVTIDIPFLRTLETVLPAGKRR